LSQVNTLSYQGSEDAIAENEELKSKSGFNDNRNGRKVGQVYAKVGNTL
jgi:hypothetical protein